LRVFVAAKRSPEAEQYARKIVEESGSLGMETVSRPEDADVIIVAGGDGTLLKYVKYGIPVLGIKFGRRSKLLEVEPEEGERALRRLIKGDYVIDEYPLLEVEMRGEKFLAFNEVALIFDGSETIVASVSFEGETINVRRRWRDNSNAPGQLGLGVLSHRSGCAQKCGQHGAYPYEPPFSLGP